MSKVSSAILRTLKIKNFADLAAMSAHWLRTQPTENANPARTKLNKVLHGHSNPLQGVKELLLKKGITKLRKNGVLAIEYVLAFSPEFLMNEDGSYKKNAKANLRQWLKESTSWLLETYGENCTTVLAHFDEKSPHIHALIVPTKAWTNKSGTNLNKLCARDITGGRQKLSQLQDSYAEHLKSKGIQLKRGVKGSKAKHQTVKQFYSAINKSKADCLKAGIVPPSNNPAEFNVWQQTIQNLTESLNKNDEEQFNKLSNMISELVITNEKLKAELSNNRGRTVSR
ncbi:MobV family relaxase [Thalassotalea castellviae]|uniref:MobV family relaxase n=1 Tax=Thalassotalea castellviae TaxID=3075612 RepID=A0ABU2ZYN5_9GAMM|nr:MobV family relaxase [Thalassotalea sp. W431]MDT0602675.1 MobV family relaxase [Thalassotalea sp. W431]